MATRKIILTICVSLSILDVFVDGELCPKIPQAPTPRHDLYLEELSGEWKLLRASANPTNADCVTYTISNDNNSIHFYRLDYSERVNGAIIKETRLVTVKLVDLTFPSHWDVWSKEAYMPTDIVATDYGNYMVMYTCNDLEGTQDTQPVWLIFGRQTSMDPILLDAILWFVDGFNQPKDELLEISHNNC